MYSSFFLYENIYDYFYVYIGETIDANISDFCMMFLVRLLVHISVFNYMLFLMETLVRYFVIDIDITNGKKSIVKDDQINTERKKKYN